MSLFLPPPMDLGASPAGHPLIGICIDQVWTSVNPARRKRSSIRHGARGSLYWLTLSRYNLDHCRNPWADVLVPISGRSGSSNVAVLLTVCQRPIVRLGLVIDFNELAPAAWSQDSMHVPQVASPSSRVDSSRNHLTMYQVKFACVEGKPADEKPVRQQGIKIGHPEHDARRLA